MSDLSNISTEELLRLRGQQQPAQTGTSDLSAIPTEQLLQMRQQSPLNMRLEPTPAPALSTFVPPEDPTGTAMPIRRGIIDPGTTERVMSSIAGERLPVPPELGTLEKIRRTGANVVIGAQRFIPEQILGALEDPAALPEAALRFIPEAYRRVATAIPGMPVASAEPSRPVFDQATRPEFKFRGLHFPTSEERSQARRELMEQPFETALAALPLLKVKPGARGAKPKPPMPEMKAPMPEPAVRPKVEPPVEVPKPVAEPVAPKAEPPEVLGLKKTEKLPATDAFSELEQFQKSISAPPEAMKPVRLLAEESAAITKRVTETSGKTGTELKLAIKRAKVEAKSTKGQQIAEEHGIALRETKGGRIVPSIRRSGVYVPEDFARYKNFKDVRGGFGGGTKDPTRAIQEMDGALSIVKKKAIPGQAGPVERYVLWRTRDISKMKMRWRGQREKHLRTTFKGISDKDAVIANRVLPKISPRGAYVAPEKLAASGPVSRITQDIKIIRFAQEARKYFDTLLKRQNQMRELRNQPTIPRRAYYTPHELQRQSLLAEAFGVRNSPVEIMRKPGLPDYIKPNKPFNPRELARRANLPEFAREMNLKRLMEHYTETAAKDMFNTSIIQNNKAFAQQLETMGHPNAARFIQDWTAERYAGVKPGFDRVAFGQAGIVGRGLEKVARKYRQALVRGVFPLNVAWNLVVQPSSSVLTYTRYGNRACAGGLLDWFTKPRVRAEIAETYSFMVKAQRAGKVTMQDVNQGLSRAVQIERGAFRTATDAFNFFTEQVERQLTGWSIATARRHGMRKGLKGKALREYASDGGSKTQSMYNMEDLPGILVNESVKTAFPFQTFAFEVFNTMREFAGRTGTPPATQMVRVKWALRFLAGMTAVNYAGNAAIGREPWGASSFIPFYNVIDVIAKSLKGESVATATTRGLPSPVGTGTQFANGLRRGLKTGDWSKLRRASIRYLPGFVGIPGGTQASRVVDGIIAISDGGVKDASGKMLFPISDDKDKARALFSGPWSTSGGQEYWKKREKSWLDLLKEKPKKKVGSAPPRGGRAARRK